MTDHLPAGIERHRGRFRARRMVDGRRIRRSFDTLEEAQAFLQMLTKDAEEAKAVEAARLTGAVTVMDVVLAWWLGPLVDGQRRSGHRSRVKGTTPRDYQYYIDAYISRIGRESAQSFARDPSLLSLYYDSLPNRVAWHVHSVLRMAFRQATYRGLIDRNPCDMERPPPRTRRPRLVPSREEADMLIEAAQEEDERWGLFVYLTATLGTRCAETVALRTEDFDEANLLVHIRRSVSKTPGRPTIKEPKSGFPRELPIDDVEFWKFVRPHLEGEGFLFPGFYRDGTRRLGEKPWHPDHASKRFRTTVRRLGLPPYAPHALRHFVATQLLIEGQPTNQVAEFLGHTPQMTLNLYGRHLDREAMRRVGRAATGLVRRPATRPPPTPPGSPPVPSGPKPKTPPMDREAAERAVLRLAESSRTLTNKLVQQKTGLTRRQASKVLDALVNDNRLTRRGERRSTHYVTAGDQKGPAR